MVKKVIIVHGWGGKPNYGWFNWIEQNLKDRNIEVIKLKMPDADNPKIEPWVNYLNKTVKNPDKDTYL